MTIPAPAVIDGDRLCNSISRGIGSILLIYNNQIYRIAENGKRQRIRSVVMRNCEVRIFAPFSNNLLMAAQLVNYNATVAGVSDYCDFASLRIAVTSHDAYPFEVPKCNLERLPAEVKLKIVPLPYAYDSAVLSMLVSCGQKAALLAHINKIDYIIKEPGKAVRFFDADLPAILSAPIATDTEPTPPTMQ